MQVSYKVRFSQSPWPRVMRVDGQLSGRSVHRGKTRLCIELRNQFFARPTLLCQGEGNSDVERKRRVQRRLHGVQDHMHGRKQSSRKLGDPRDIQLFGVGSVGEGEMPQCRRARLWEVRQSRSTEEMDEQCWKANGSGVHGGKGTDRRERQTVVNGPDSEPGCHVARTVWRTRSSTASSSDAQSSSSLVRAVCGSSARTDLCGGRPVMAVPTAMHVRSCEDFRLQKNHVLTDCGLDS